MKLWKAIQLVRVFIDGHESEYARVISIVPQETVLGPVNVLTVH